MGLVAHPVTHENGEPPRPCWSGSELESASVSIVGARSFDPDPDSDPDVFVALT